ncbi:hypothetical protein [Helicobacter sp. T3_23-1059]
MKRQLIKKSSLYCGVLLAGIMLCGCYTTYERPHHLNLYNKFYTPAMKEQEVKALKSKGDFPKEIIAKSGLSRNLAEKFHSELVNFYGCILIGQSHFIGEDGFTYKSSTSIDAYGISHDEYEYFKTDDVKDPERLAQKVGANYYITYIEHTDPTTTTISGADTKVAAQGGMGRAQTGTITTTTSAGKVLRRGASFYLCD